jgi:hypothetical protein
MSTVTPVVAVVVSAADANDELSLATGWTLNRGELEETLLMDMKTSAEVIDNKPPFLQRIAPFRENKGPIRGCHHDARRAWRGPGHAGAIPLPSVAVDG